jgi:Domain of Unknown Function (DUF326)
MHFQAMLKTHPAARSDVNEFALRATEACFDCAQACVACANACLAEESLAELRHCILVNLDCAVVCSAASVLGIRGTISDETVIMEMMFGLCAEACRRCGDECLRQQSSMSIVEPAPSFAGVAQRHASPCAKSRPLHRRELKPGSNGKRTQFRIIQETFHVKLSCPVGPEKPHKGILECKFDGVRPRMRG